MEQAISTPVGPLPQEAPPAHTTSGGGQNSSKIIVSPAAVLAFLDQPDNKRALARLRLTSTLERLAAAITIHEANGALEPSPVRGEIIEGPSKNHLEWRLIREGTGHRIDSGIIALEGKETLS